MAKLQSFPPVWIPATTFLATCLLLVASLVSSMPGLMVTKPSHCYSRMEQVWLFVVVSKLILPVLLVGKCEHMINLGWGKGNFFACCSALEEFTNSSVAFGSKSTEWLYGRKIFWGSHLQSQCFLCIQRPMKHQAQIRIRSKVAERDGYGHLIITVCGMKGASMCYQKTWLRGGRQTPKRYWLLFSAQVLYSTEVQRPNSRSVEARLNAKNKNILLPNNISWVLLCWVWNLAAISIPDLLNISKLFICDN